MSVYTSILIAFFVFGLSFARLGRNITSAQNNKPEVFTEPVARTYTILYWSTAAHILAGILGIAWTFISTRPWKRYTTNYVAQHHLHNSTQFLQRQDEILILIGAMIGIVFIASTVFTQSMKYIIIILFILVGSDVLHVVTDFTGPTYRLLYDLLWTAFSALVLWSLVMREPDFPKLLRHLQNTIKK